MIKRVAVALAAVALIPVAAISLRTTAAHATTACQIDSPAFCETFDAAGSGVGRSPALSSVWGVSRNMGGTNFGQGAYYAQNPTTLNQCGTQVTGLFSPNDVAVCNGLLVESVTDGIGVDNGTVTDLALYPKQPFDWAGRTGTVTFDVSDDSHGPHRAWPELWISNKPTPAPFTHFSSFQQVPQYGIGIRFAGCGSSGPVVGVDSAVVVNNYLSNDSFMDKQQGSINVQSNGCVAASSGIGNMNHVKVSISDSEIAVYMTNAGDVQGAMVKVATISNFGSFSAMGFTRGLVWLSDVHYNGNKDGIDQGTHTFSWDNVGFDGPVLPQDLAFDAPDALTHANDPAVLNLGYFVNPTTTQTLSISGPTATNIAAASGALLTLNYHSEDYNPPWGETTLSYKLNGETAWTDVPWPFPDAANGGQYGWCSQAGWGLCEPSTLAIPFDKSRLVDGNNTVTFKASEPTAIANVDIIEVGAGGGGSPPPSTTTTVPSPTTTVPPTTTSTVPATTTTTRGTCTP